jgi:hypothetical protein
MSAFDKSQKGMTVDIWIRDYNPPRCFQKKISGRGITLSPNINQELRMRVVYFSQKLKLS